MVNLTRIHSDHKSTSSLRFIIGRQCLSSVLDHRKKKDWARCQVVISSVRIFLSVSIKLPRSHRLFLSLPSTSESVGIVHIEIN